MIERVENGGVPQKVDHDVAEARIEFHQIGRHAEIALIAPQGLLPDAGRGGTDGGQRIEGGASRVVILEVADRRLCGILALHHDILQTCAQCRFHGDAVFRLHRNDAGHRTAHACDLTPLCRLHHAADALRIALEQLLHALQCVDTLLA